MKHSNTKMMSVNGLFNNEQNTTVQKSLTNYIKTIVLIVAVSMLALFSNGIQNTLVNNYTKSIAFIQKYNATIILPQGV